MKYDPAFALDQKRRLFRLQKERCASCKCHMQFFGSSRHHIIPRKANGSNEDWNIALICFGCHEKCHSSDRDERHDALRPILIDRGFTPEDRSQIYSLYRRVGVKSDNLRHLRNQMYPVSRSEYARFEDDGGGGAIRQ